METVEETFERQRRKAREVEKRLVKAFSPAIPPPGETLRTREPELM